MNNARRPGRINVRRNRIHSKFPRALALSAGDALAHEHLCSSLILTGLSYNSKTKVCDLLLLKLDDVISFLSELLVYKIIV